LGAEYQFVFIFLFKPEQRLSKLNGNRDDTLFLALASYLDNKVVIVYVLSGKR
jgi:hypothetical protein